MNNQSGMSNSFKQNNNRYRYFIDALVHAFVLYPNSVENVMKLVNENNNCLDEPL